MDHAGCALDRIEHGLTVAEVEQQRCQVADCPRNGGVVGWGGCCSPQVWPHRGLDHQCGLSDDRIGVEAREHRLAWDDSPSGTFSGLEIAEQYAVLVHMTIIFVACVRVDHDAKRLDLDRGPAPNGTTECHLDPMQGVACNGVDHLLMKAWVRFARVE